MFNAEINRALIAAADLINTDEGLRSAKRHPDSLETVEGLKTYLAEQDPQLNWPSSTADRKDLQRVRQLRSVLRQVWSRSPVTTQETVELVNQLLDGVGTRLEPVDPAEKPLRFHVVPVPVSKKVSDVMTATFAASLSHLVTEEETGRLRICKGEDCDAAIVDLTRNRSKLFCDFGNCANRAHVRAYRARQAARRSDETESTNGRSSAPRKITKPSSAEKAAALNQPTSASAVAAKQFRERMRSELMEERAKREKKAKKRSAD
ncbi:CGNR zinc finger domain-containing protein [Nesterenkonia alba]|uniref:CGNR zinc finger domain-containing protein n=1 Tax=Nesterenkonia alba TaxID=515814 RepID=UPI0003B5CEAD|nr:CGNR zinc finger domain-containing protein [Nesterenkonia alba]